MRPLSPPSGLPPSGPKFIESSAPKLLSMLDGEQGPDAVSISGEIIGKKILGNRSSGAPGTVGWELFVEPIHRALDPSAKVDMVPGDGDAQVLVSAQELARALRRLSTLAAAHPSQNLVARLVSPVLLPLWALVAYTSSSRESSGTALTAFWLDVPRALLETYLRLSGGVPQVKALADHICFDGGKEWVFAAQEGGEVLIKKRAMPRVAEYASLSQEEWAEVAKRLKVKEGEDVRRVFERESEAVLGLLLTFRELRN